MAFLFVPEPEFSAVIRISVPGKESAASLFLRFRHLGKAELAEWVKLPATMPDHQLSDAEYLGRVIVGWDGVTFKDGSPVPYTKGALARLLDAYPASGAEIFKGYVRELTESRAGN